MDIKALKSGTDLRGTAVGDNPDLSDGAVYAAVSAFLVWLKERTGKDASLKVGLGHDSRVSAERICDAAVRAMKDAGAEIYFAALCSTPSAFMMTQYPETNCDGAIMVTASHHPSDKNGLKFFTKSGGVESADLDKIIAYAEADKRIVGEKSKLFKSDFMKLYCASLLEKVRGWTGEETPLAGMKIAVDAGNGAGGFFAERVLRPLGADVSSSQFLDADGTFPNHVPNPENPQAMESISARVKETKSDLGVIFDTDVDRAAIVAADGAEINRNSLIALISAVLLTENPGATIVTDSVTSDGLKEFITACGGVHRRFKRGYRNVINEAIRLEKQGVSAPLAIETSGHAAFKENYFLDDGAYLALRLIAEAAKRRKQGKTLISLIAGLKQPLESREARILLNTPDFKEVGDAVLQQLQSVCEQLQQSGFLTLADDSCEGIRANVGFADGFFLARMSVHDPVMPINIESYKEGGVKEIAGFLYAFFGAYSRLDCTALQRAAED